MNAYLQLLCYCLTAQVSHGLSSTNSNKKTIFLPQLDNLKIQRRKLEGKVPIRSREVPIYSGDIQKITIWELEDPSKLMELWWAGEQTKLKDPFGVINWPGSTLCCKEMVKFQHHFVNKTVLSLGAGTGVEAQCAALLGASEVIALDISKFTLKLLMYGAKENGVDHIIRPLEFDLFSKCPLPECDIVLAADVLYNPELALQIGNRIYEILSRNKQVQLIVTDSQRFHGTDFVPSLNKALQGKYHLEWDEYELKGFRGSGIMIRNDQTYDVTTRMISFGF